MIMREALHITYVGHATCLVEMDGVRLLTDPVLRNRVGHIRRQGQAVDPEWSDRIDAVLISHAHLDHLDLPSLRRLGRDMRLIAPAGSGLLLARHGFQNVEELRAGDWTRVKSVDVEATLATHDGARFPFGPVTDTLGYVMHGARAVYFAGDTDLFPEMDGIHDSLDVALLPVWGWGPTLGEGHMNPRRAAESLRMLRPRKAIPIHWGTFAPLGMGWLNPRFLIDPPYHFVEHASDLAPDVDVHVVHPGNRFRLVN
ncbi:MAG TPA: MBL fold metallo-hydrolase [Candidatus Krumholzibacteria bacterium]|nr:MBL fold metallo-hydrolase [Candidatus Krumholzibacteria bacterium]